MRRYADLLLIHPSFPRKSIITVVPINMGLNVILPKYCPAVKCTRRPEVGTHVQKDVCSDSGWYIVPLCVEHSGETGKSLEISNMIDLVSASVRDTCAK